MWSVRAIKLRWERDRLEHKFKVQDAVRRACQDTDQEYRVVQAVKQGSRVMPVSLPQSRGVEQ